MIPILYRYLGGALVFFLLLSGSYLKGKQNGKEIVQAKFDRYKEVAQLAYDRQVAKTAEIQAQWDAIVGERDAIRKELVAASEYGASLADRLREHSRRRVCAVSDPPSPAAGTGESSPQSNLDERIEQATQRIFADAAADAKQLDEVVDRYNKARQAQLDAQ